MTPVSDVGYTRGVTANSVKRYLCIAISLPLAGLLAQTQQPGGDPSISPNKQWEYRVSKESAVLVKAGSEEPVVDLAEEIGGLAIESGKVVWAPDSRRFAFNTRKGGKYYGCELYELKGTTWEKLPQLETSAEAVERLIERTLAKQRKRLGAEKGAGDYVMTQWRVRRWLDNDTFEAYASETRRVMLRESDDEPEYFGCAVLLSAKCDNRGAWKVTTRRVLSDAESRKINEADDQ